MSAWALWDERTGLKLVYSLPGGTDKPGHSRYGRKRDRCLSFPLTHSLCPSETGVVTLPEGGAAQGWHGREAGTRRYRGDWQ